jgi:hypothetical protein
MVIATLAVTLMPYSVLGKAYADETETLPLTGTVGSTINHDEDRFVITVSTSDKTVATASIGTVRNGFTPIIIQCKGQGTADITMKDSLGDTETDSVQCTQPSSIPEFPFSFNLVIIFVAVAAVYMVIRQKMTSFKRY